MILVRDVFRLKFGKAKEAKALWKEMVGIQKSLGIPASRGLVGFVGEYYTFVLESTHANLAEFEQSMSAAAGSDEFHRRCGKSVPLVDSGPREILTILD